METASCNCDEEQKWEADEEEEEETLSLCDLPVSSSKEENQVQPKNEEDGESQAIKTEEDFNFGSWGGFLSTRPEMCTADEVFFKGQILPFRVSVSSDNGLNQVNENKSRCLSRSGSMDYGSISRFTSVTSSSSRSNSTGSSNSSSITTVTTRSFNSKSNPNEIINNFNTHPSPKPQIRLSKTRPVNVSMRNQTSSSMWDFFRLGLVRAPELELHDLKNRTNNNNSSRNNSCNSSNNNNNNQLDSIKGFLRKGLFSSGCKCAVDVIETFPLNSIVFAKNMPKKNSNDQKKKATLHAAMEEKTKLVQQVKIKKKLIEEKRERKQTLSRQRTFQWLKELSHASFVDESLINNPWHATLFPSFHHFSTFLIMYFCSFRYLIV